MNVVCPYCNNPASLVGGDIIYPHRDDLYEKKFWLCGPCDAYVGCHNPNAKYGFNGTEPLGRLADKELRKAKSDAHKVFDALWKNGTFKTRTAAYEWLAKQLKISMFDCHIGMFDINTCKRVIIFARVALEKRKGA